MASVKAFVFHNEKCLWSVRILSSLLTANEEYYQLLRINERQPLGLDVSSYTVEEIDSITSEYTLKNNVSHPYVHLPTCSSVTDCTLTFCLGRTSLRLLCLSAQGGSCTFQTRPRPYSTAKETCSKTPSLWSSWRRRMSACSTALPRPTGSPPGACPPEQVNGNVCRHGFIHSQKLPL